MAVHSNESLFVFWLPLSWVQCSDMYFGIKQFVDIWSKFWFIPKTTEIISDIVVDQVYQTIDLIKDELDNTYDPDKIGENDDIYCSMFNILKQIIDQFVKTLKLIEPALRKFNSFIQFYESMFQSGE